VCGYRFFAVGVGRALRQYRWAVGGLGLGRVLGEGRRSLKRGGGGSRPYSGLYSLGDLVSLVDSLPPCTGPEAVDL